MWQVENRTPFSAERGWVRDRDGAEIWLVAVKCTFDIKPDGTTEVSTDQPPVLRVPEYYGAPGKSSLKYDADLILTKKTTDVIVIGHAYAPDGRPVHELNAGFRVGTTRKLLRVTGDRTWSGTRSHEPRPFTKMPLLYERAFGGVDGNSERPERDWEWRNPIGTAFAVKKENLADRLLPNFEYPDKRFQSWNDRPPPAGFGALCSHWQPRAGFAGTYDDKWTKERQPLLPADLDDRFFQCAPVDQQSPEFLRGGEPVVLLNLTPGGKLVFYLPRLSLGFDTRFFNGERELHKMRRLHTVILEPDYPRVSLVWHTALPCHFKVQKLERTIVTLKRRIGDRPEAEADDIMETA